ncbi:MFS general substrate transporter [Xylariaceae sp. FL0804]|nr:MFS general substrate transporter [Xylariaceae sp. FL0804]
MADEYPPASASPRDTSNNSPHHQDYYNHRHYQPHDHDAASESSPLLAVPGGGGGGGGGGNSYYQQSLRPQARQRLSVASIASAVSFRSIQVPQVKKNSNVVNLLCAIIFITTSSNGFLHLPFLRLLEDVLCHQYYNNGGGPDWDGGPPRDDGDLDYAMCKADPIQARLAFITAIGPALEAVIGFLVAFPWGIVADRIGRKPVFSLALTGLIVSVLWVMTVAHFHNTLPIEAVWLGSAGQIIGGGNAVLAGVVLSMITDETTAENRGTSFLRCHVGTLAGQLLSPALAGLMMERTGPWPCLWLAVGLLLFGAISFLFVPETMQHKKQLEPSFPEPPAPPSRQPSQQQQSGFVAKMARSVRRFLGSMSMLRSPSLVILLTMALALVPTVYSTLQFMAQFASKRYGIEIAQTGYIQFVYGVVQIFQLLVLLPFLSRLLVRPSTPRALRARDAHHRDLGIARASFAALFVGALVLALSPGLGSFVFGLVLMALGSAASSLCKATMSLYVTPSQRSRLYSLVGMAEVLGTVYAQPMLAGLFVLGLRLNGGWIGLPYFGVSVSKLIPQES